ncbi:MAG: RING finger protein [Acutalibacter sp.]|jgi:hypothetical protein
MLDYTGIKCPVCGVPFRSGDDIVVCPECGAPYHRACYQEKGKCIFDDLHQEGKAWEPPAPPKAPDPSAEIKDQECPVCGTLNAHSALFCNRCGASLTGGPQQYRNTGYNNGQASPYNQVPPFAFDPMGGVSPAEPLDAGVTFGDASKLVKQNTAYYMPVFRYIKQTGRNKFNFMAFLCSGAWMLYRKQYKSGAIVTGIMFLLYIGYLCLNLFVANPVLMDLMVQAGIDPAQTTYPTNDQIMAMSRVLMETPIYYLYLLLPMLCLAGMLAVMIVVGVRGNKMYLRHCVRTIQEVKGSAGDGDPSNTLDAKGGVNTSIAICIFVCYLIVVNIPLLL